MYMPAAALQGGKAAPASPSNPNDKSLWDDRRQQQQGGQSCSICKRPAHSDNACWYNDPHAALEFWAPSVEASYKAIQLYQRRCAELGIAPKQPGARAAPQQQQQQQRGRAPPCAQAAAAAAAVAGDNAQPDLHAAGALMPDINDIKESLSGWYLAGSCRPAQPAHYGSSSSSSSISSFERTAFAAALNGRDKQPLSFLPPVEAQPCDRTKAASSAADKPATATCTADDVQVQVIITGSPDKLGGILQHMGMSGLVAKPTPAPAASAGGRAAAAATQGEPPGPRISAQPAVGLGVNANSNAGDSSSSCSSSSRAPLPSNQLVAADDDATVAAAAAACNLLQPEEAAQLAAHACPGRSNEQLLAAFKAGSATQTMLTFTSSDPAQVPMILTNKGPVMPFKTVADSGCEPCIITRAQADASQISYRPLAEGKLNIVNIEGDKTSCFIGRTEPVSVSFGHGTAHEVSVFLKDGFLVNGNAAADNMYSCVLGRSCLDKLSGFVVPVLQTFFYMPHLEQLDFSLASMPVRLGRAQQSSSSAASLMAISDPVPLFACAAMSQGTPHCSSTGQGCDEEDTTGQGSGTCSARPMLHFCSSSSAGDVQCSMPPPQQATWEFVPADSSSAAATPKAVSDALDDNSSQHAADTTRKIAADGTSSSSSSSNTAASTPATAKAASDAAFCKSSSTTLTEQPPQPTGCQQQQLRMPPIYAACSWTANSLLWLLSLLPLLLLTCMSNTLRSYVLETMGWLYRMLLQPAPYQEQDTLYYRLGRIHHSSRNFFGFRHTIKVRMREAASGKGFYSKPKIMEVKHRNPFALRFALTAVPVKLLFMMLVLALFCTTSASAMQLRTHTAALGFNLLSTTPDPCPVPPPCCTGQVLAWTVSSELGNLCPAAGAQQCPPAPTSTSPSILDAFTPDGEKELADLNSRWEIDPEHQRIYGNHQDTTPVQKKQLKHTLLEEKGAFAYQLQDLVGYSGNLGPAVLHMKHDKPIWSPERNYSPLERQIGRDKLSEMFESGIIELADTLDAKYASAPTMPAKRAPDGSWSDKRFCVDLHGINNGSVVDRYKMPMPDDLFKRTQGATWFSKIDCRSGFFNIPL
jgi:hypothetical protein